MFENLDQYPNLTTACEAVASRLGLVAESLRHAQVDVGDHEGLTMSESVKIRRPERESRELREANAILKDAAAFFAGQPDSRRRRSSDSSGTNERKVRRSSRSARCCDRRACRSPREPIGRGRASVLDA